MISTRETRLEALANGTATFSDALTELVRGGVPAIRRTSWKLRNKVVLDADKTQLVFLRGLDPTTWVTRGDTLLGTDWAACEVEL